MINTKRLRSNWNIKKMEYDAKEKDVYDYISE